MASLLPAYSRDARSEKTPIPLGALCINQSSSLSQRQMSLPRLTGSEFKVPCWIWTFTNNQENKPPAVIRLLDHVGEKWFRLTSKPILPIFVASQKARVKPSATVHGIIEIAKTKYQIPIKFQIPIINGWTDSIYVMLMKMPFSIYRGARCRVPPSGLDVARRFNL